MTSIHDSLREEARRVVDSGALGRSVSYARLLLYLVECSAANRAPKELEIAMEVFGKGPDFEPSQDAMVRVYAHNLRQKLQQYYAGQAAPAAARLMLPRGEYRIQLVKVGAEPAWPETIAAALPAVTATATTDDRALGPPPDAEPRAAALPAATAPHSATIMVREHRRRWVGARMAAGALAVLACGVLLGFSVASGPSRAPSPAAVVAASPVWAPLFDDALPVLIVVGDYYIFGERDANGGVSRLVRDFEINSSKELDDRMLSDDSSRGRYIDLDLTYLPAGSAFALRDVLRIAHTGSKPVRIVSMSELSASDLKTGHIVYLGYISALGMLQDFVFASSGLTIGYNYDELRNRVTGEVYASEAGLPGSHRNYRDYGLVSTFPGPSGNQFLVVAGTRDAGLMQAAHVLSEPMFLGEIYDAAPKPDVRPLAPAFELLYEVAGYGRTNLDAMLIHTSELSYRTIWGGDLKLEAY